MIRGSCKIWLNTAPLYIDHSISSIVGNGIDATAASLATKTMLRSLTAPLHQASATAASASAHGQGLMKSPTQASEHGGLVQAQQLGEMGVAA